MIRQPCCPTSLGTRVVIVPTSRLVQRLLFWGEEKKKKSKGRHILRDRKTDMWLYLDNDFLFVARTTQVYY